MKLNLLTVTSLLCGLLLLGSCAKDEPQGDTKKEQSVAGGPLVSIDLDMDVAVAAFNESEAKAQEGRAFTSPQTPVTVKDGAKEELDDNLDPISGKQQKILSVLRDKFIENNQTIDVVMHFECGTKMANVATKMSYDNSIKRYKHGLGENNRNINVPQEILTEMGKGKNAKVTIYTGGSSYDEANERFTVDPVMKEVNLSSLASTPINIPVLYISTGTELKVENGKLVSASTELDKLKPQGSLLLVTFRNNMDQNVTFDGVTAVSNNYFGPNDQSKKSFLKVKGATNPATELTTEAPSYTSPYNTAVDGGKAYTYFYKGFAGATGASASYTVAKGGAIADKAIIFWGIKGDATKVASPSANALGDNGYLLNPATGLIHVYAKNAKQGDKDIIYPNYNVAPIGGAYFYPESGKAYTLNCEFYTQPRQALGYLDKGYLYKDGTWKHHEFDGTTGSNNPNTYNTKEMRKVPLVNSAEVKEVLDGNVTTTKGAMRVMDQAWLNLTSLLYPLEFKTDMSSRRFKDITLGKGAKGYDLRAHIYSELLPYKATNDDTSEFTNASFIAADYVQKGQAIETDRTKKVYAFGYRHLYIAPRKGSASARPGAHPRSKYQVIVRYLSRAEQGEGENKNNVYVGPIVIESVYLGKYFFGNMMTTPIYLSGNAASPFVYGQESAVYSTAGRVSRVLLNANVMSSLTKDDILKPYSVMKDKAENTGIQLLHWGVVDQQWEKAVIELGNQPAKVVKYAEDIFNNVISQQTSIQNRFYGYNGIDGGILTIWRNPAVQNNDITGRFYSNNYQPLRAYSLKYQGNDGFHPTAD
ncbi:MAG: hypothetical protein HXN11_06940 [Porphyromonadaceae bacterium]|nr:hypothetical protein [Porphyromonadaceae bacterium]